MTAKIKLNASSGGGSVSIQAPSSSSNNRVISLPDIADGTLVTSQSTLDATKLSGALPAISGANLTGISAGISMLDMYFLKQNVAAGNDTEITLDSYLDRMTVFSNSVFTGIGTGMTKSGSVFSFPSTGHYEIDFHAQFSCQGYDSARYTHADILYTVDDSNYNVLNRSRGQSIEYPTNLSNRFSINITTAIFDVTNTSTHKVQFVVQHDQPYILFGSTSEVTTYIIFKKLGDT